MAANQRQVPEFGTEDEEREFWATHDSPEYIDWREAAQQKFPLLQSSEKKAIQPSKPDRRYSQP